MDFNWDGVNLAKLSHGPALDNLHNDCFINSVLQFVFHTPQLVRFVIWKRQKMNLCNDCNQCFYCILNGYFRMIGQGVQIFETNDIREIVNSQFPNRIANKQEDAHEMLTFLLDKLRSNMRKSNSLVPWNFQPEKPTGIDVLFRGKILNYMMCKACKNTWAKSEDFQELNLDLNLKGLENNQLEHYIRKYFKTEPLINHKCEKCEKKSTYHKFFIQKSPNLLIIQLKRFRLNATKNSAKIEIAHELKLEEYFKEKPRKPNLATYKLYGFISHNGASIENGHYTSTMRGYDSNWYLFDDSIVKLSDPEKWTSSQADPYILFYYNVASQNVIKKDEPKIKENIEPEVNNEDSENQEELEAERLREKDSSFKKLELLVAEARKERLEREELLNQMNQSAFSDALGCSPRKRPLTDQKNLPDDNIGFYGPIKSLCYWDKSWINTDLEENLDSNGEYQRRF